MYYSLIIDHCAECSRCARERARRESSGQCAAPGRARRLHFRVQHGGAAAGFLLEGREAGLDVGIAG
eukprot:1233086-Lingulodinium_polyedra.AAC.1